MLSSIGIEEKNGKPRTVIHLLNGSGISMKPGTLINSATPAGSWTALSRPVVLDVKTMTGKKAYAVSPDFSGRRSVEAKRLDADTVRISIPPELLTRYTIVYLEMDEEK